ncbi:hypothetical protein BOX15_Mlig016489g1 [Macrostomum lignano]|uniref:SCP domain-containing protein n=1 Tax=Macrostomum lignano TaxID=282301 RepID=A0A267H2I3_9PLAT|nr:hypothetical protein BOX15_Mlig016489g1 [Macrostomum lignano]
MLTKIMKNLFSIGILLSILTVEFIDAILDRQQQLSFLNEHNRFRELAYPTASRMLYLIWREHLAQYAEREANELCYIVHQTDTVWYIKMGDSWLSYQTTENVLPTAWQIVDAWHSTGRSYRSTGACSGENTNCQPYLQIMSDKLDSLGCAYYLCHGVHTFVCYYSHKAAVHGSRVYAVGEPCSACPNSLPLCLNNLCIDKMIVRDPTVPVYKGSDSSQRPFCTRDCETCEQRLIGQCRRCDCSNGGTRRPEATPSNCRCTCPIGYFGRQCQVTLARYKNSVALRLGVRGPGKLSMSLRTKTRSTFLPI